MQALILRSRTDASARLLPIAGQPLIIRQLEWLRAEGCESIVVALGSTPEDEEALALLGDRADLQRDVRVVLVDDGDGPSMVAGRAGLAGGAPFVTIPGDVLCDVDLAVAFARAGGRETSFSLLPPTGVVAYPAIITIGTGQPTRNGAQPLEGWGVHVRNGIDALRLSQLVLSPSSSPSTGQPSSQEAPSGVKERSGLRLVVPAPERAPGVFVSHFAFVSEDARLIAPCFIGPGASIGRGAVVGPRAEICADAVVDEGAVVSDAIVTRGTWVGERMGITRAVAAPGRIRDLERPRQVVELDDPLLLGARDQGAVSWLPSKILAGLAAIVVAPLAMILPRARGLLARLAEVVLGRSALVGVSPLGSGAGGSSGLLRAASRAPRGLIDITRALVPGDAPLDVQLRAHAWYAEQKRALVDLRLLAARLTVR